MNVRETRSLSIFVQFLKEEVSKTNEVKITDVEIVLYINEMTWKDDLHASTDTLDFLFSIH